MLTMSFWRRFSRRRRRHKNSFYDSQHVMREAAQANAFGVLRYQTDEVLQRIVETEGGTPRADAAQRVLEERKGTQGASGAS